MTIEIRPAAVRNQISEKKRLLNRMAIAASVIRSAVTNFCAAQEFSGDAYTVAREHMAKYLNYLDVFEACIEKVRAADNQIRDALGAFGGMSVVSEQEWLDSKRQAKWWAMSCWSRSSYYLQNYLEYGYSEAYSNCVDRAREWEGRADRAEEMLSKIRSYREQTDNVHGGDDLSALYDAVRAGSAAFVASCTYDAETHVWGKVDSSWYDDTRIIACQDYYLRLACGNTQPLAIHDAESDGIRKVCMGVGLLVLTIGGAVVSAPAAATFGVTRSLFFAGGVVTDTTTGVALTGSGAVEIHEGKDPEMRDRFEKGVADNTPLSQKEVSTAIDISNLSSAACGCVSGGVKSSKLIANDFSFATKEIDGIAVAKDSIYLSERSAKSIPNGLIRANNARDDYYESLEVSIDALNGIRDAVETPDTIRNLIDKWDPRYQEGGMNAKNGIVAAGYGI